MVNSINTNIGAMSGLRRLSSARAGLEKIQAHISSGKKINSPKDDAATLAIAQQLLGTYAGTAAVRDGLVRASATIDVAMAAGQSTADILVEMKGLAVQANQEGLDQSSRNALNTAFNALREQITTINDSAEFAGANIIAAGAADQFVLSDENGARIAVGAQDLSSGGLGLDGLALDSLGNVAGALGALDAAIADGSAKLASLGSSAKRIESHNELLGRQNDTLRAGIGNLVDADMAEESAALQSFQIKEALAAVSLGIANSAPSRILGLFSG
jgi:flagellin